MHFNLRKLDKISKVFGRFLPGPRPKSTVPRSYFCLSPESGKSSGNVVGICHFHVLEQ